MKRKNRQLGMDRDITRRDFLNGTSIAVGGSLLATPLSQALAALDSSPSEQMMPGYGTDKLMEIGRQSLDEINQVAVQTPPISAGYHSTCGLALLSLQLERP